MLKNRIEKQLGGTLRTLALIGAGIFAFSGCGDKKNDPAKPKENEGPKSVVDYVNLLDIGVMQFTSGRISMGFPETDDDFVTLYPGMTDAAHLADSIQVERNKDTSGNDIPVRMSQLSLPVEGSSFLRLDTGVIRAITFRTKEKKGNPTGYNYKYLLMKNVDVVFDFGTPIPMKNGHLNPLSDSSRYINAIENSLQILQSDEFVAPVGARKGKSIFEY